MDKLTTTGNWLRFAVIALVTQAALMLNARADGISTSFVDAGKSIVVIVTKTGSPSFSSPAYVSIDVSSAVSVDTSGCNVTATLGGAYVTSCSYSFSIPLKYRDGATHTAYISADLYSTSTSFRVASPSYSHVRYFGYYYSSYPGHDFADQVKDHANTMWIVSPTADIEPLLRHARDLNMRVIIDTSLATFGSLDTCVLPSKWEDEWRKYSAVINPYVQDGTIIAFYPKDEPDSGCAGAVTTIIARVKRDFPRLPSAVIGNGSGVHFDWVGIDPYGDFYNLDVAGKFRALKSGLDASQRIILVPYAFSSRGYSTTEAKLRVIADQNFDLAADPTVIGVIPFIYQTGATPDGNIGVQDFPTLRAKYVDFAKLLAPLPAPLAHPPTGTISSVYARKCIDIDGGKAANGTPVQIWDCNSSAGQSWTISPYDYTIRSLGKCLDVTGGFTSAGTRVQLWECNGSGAQQWILLPGGALKNPYSGRCLDDLAWNTSNGAPLGIWDCNGYANQQWTQL